ncbi:MAG TPA: NUDIX hydrolase [Patescibacteria group bacterium]|nr:NUDIX hydrolase [Patescibacteria group bacterium]
MRSTFLTLGRITYWLAWPLFKVYLGRSIRSRIVIVHKHKVLLIKSWISPGWWELPGGGLHRNEDARIGVCRETYEETGLTLQPADLKDHGTAEFNTYGHHYPYHIFSIQLRKEPAVRLRWYEIAEASWQDIKELDLSTLGPDAATAITRVSGALGVRVLQ